MDIFKDVNYTPQQLGTARYRVTNAIELNQHHVYVTWGTEGILLLSSDRAISSYRRNNYVEPFYINLNLEEFLELSKDTLYAEISEDVDILSLDNNDTCHRSTHTKRYPLYFLALIALAIGVVIYLLLR